MFLFGYKHTSGSVMPADDDICRVMVFPGKSNNVLVWRGYDENISQYTIDREVIWEIEGLIEEQMELADAEKLDKKYLPALDVPVDYFAFIGGEGRFRSFSDVMLSCEKGKDSGIDKIIDLIFKIQDILQKNGVDVTMLTKGDLDNSIYR